MRRRAAHAQLRPRLRRPPRPHREEAALPLPPRLVDPLPRHRRLQPGLRLLPELADLPGRRAARGRSRREQAVAMAAGRAAATSASPITYNEPFMWYEFVLETARAGEGGGPEERPGHQRLRRTRSRCASCCPFIDAMNVDVKSMSERFYRELCRGQPEPPRRTVEIAKEQGCLVEVTNLVIPNWNDSDEETCRRWWTGWRAWTRSMPLHFSRYHPDYQLTSRPRPGRRCSTRAGPGAREAALRLRRECSARRRGTTCPNCKRTVIVDEASWHRRFGARRRVRGTAAPRLPSSWAVATRSGGPAPTGPRSWDGCETLWIGRDRDV